MKLTPEQHFLEAKELVRDLTDMVIWMSGSPDFGPGGSAHNGFLAMQERLERAMMWLSNK